jgi:protein phosphatase
MTTEDLTTVVTVGCATIQGPKHAINADSAAHYRYPASGVLAAALVDGMGSGPETVEFARVAAYVSVRVGARKGALPGVLAAAELVADPTAEAPRPDGSIVLAVVRPGQPTVIGHVGDCRAWAWEDGDLTQLTVDHTKGWRIRQQGLGDEKRALRSDNVVVSSLSRATVGTVAIIESAAPTIVLTCDGIHQTISPAELAAITSANPDPVGCAQALVDAAREAGARDDMTALVLRRPVPDGPGVRWGR